MRLIFVRHGETDWVKRRLYQGSTDVALNQRGLAQAKRLAKIISSKGACRRGGGRQGSAIVLGGKKEKPFAIYCSEFLRVRQTANVIAKACGKKPIVDKRLNEISFGVWEGRSFREVRQSFPEEVYKWYHTTWTSRPSGGESLKSLRSRTSSFLKDLIGKYGKRDETCVLVTHGGPIRMFMLELLQIPVSLFWSIRVDPASVSAVNIAEKYTEVTLLNSQAHLDGVQTVFK